MKKINILLGLLVLGIMISLVNFVSADGNACRLNVSLINQDPYPAVPDNYVEIVFDVSGVDNPQCNGARFELIPSYPFSLDEDKGVLTLAGGTYMAEYKSDWMIPYKLRVDKDALDGNAEITVHYSYGKLDWDPSSYITQKFDIIIQDSRTSFDAVIQDSTSSEISIAIANIGKYTANSVVVKIPAQDSFRAVGTDGQMVGNLESGDYTIVGFGLSQKAAPRNISRTNPQGTSNNLKFDIYYTDNIGERRVVNMDLPLSLNSGNSTMGGFGGRGGTQTSSSWSNWYTLIIIVVIIGGGFFAYKKYPKQTKEFLGKIKNSFKKKEVHNSHSDKVPDWVKNVREKEKKK